jgi:hypothetical protein
MRSMVAGKGGSPISGSASGSDTGQRQYTRSLPLPPVVRSVGWATSIE